MFSSFISLGPHCATAASMSKYGLRSFSGPFDWLVSEHIEWIFYYIENDFRDFFVFENLECYQNNLNRCRDRKSGFIFLHEERAVFSVCVWGMTN